MSYQQITIETKGKAFKCPLCEHTMEWWWSKDDKTEHGYGCRKCRVEVTVRGWKPIEQSLIAEEAFQ